MKSFKDFKEAFGDKYQGHDVDNGPKKSEKKMKGKKTVALKGGTSVTTMPKTPEGPDKALGIKEEIIHAKCSKCGNQTRFCNCTQDPKK